MCYENWSEKNGLVLCKQLGDLELVKQEKRAPSSSGDEFSTTAYACAGNEENLMECPTTSQSAPCYDGQQVFLKCGEF